MKTNLPTTNSLVAKTTIGFNGFRLGFRFILIQIIFALALFGSQNAVGQTVSTTLEYTGGGFCDVCGDASYVCSTWVEWTPSKTFTDPTPAGSTVTQLSFTYYGDCTSNFTVQFNGVNVVSTSSPGSCQCSCSSQVFTTTNAAVLAAYNQSGTNTVTTNVSSGTFCVNRIVVGITYTACSLPTTPSLSWNPNPVCAGSGSNLNISGTLNSATAWQVYTGSCGGSLVGSTSGSQVNLGPAYSSQYFVRGTGGCANPSSVTIACASIGAPTIDNVAPSAHCQNATVTLNGSGTGSIGTGSINSGSTDNCTISSYSLSQTNFSCSNLGNNTVTLTVTDNNGNSSSCNATVTVVDSQAPTISCPANISTNVTAGTCARVVTYTTPTASDNCPGVTVTRTAGPASGSSFPVGTTTVTHQATTPSGQTASCSFTVTVIDNQSPAITCPANISVNAANGTCSANVSYSSPTVSDNCSATLSLTSGPSSGSSFPLGSTTIGYTATDPAGLTASCSFSVTVNDNQNPSITCPSNITTTALTGTCARTVTYSPPSATDNCPGVSASLVSGLPSGSSFPVGTTTVGYMASDGVGNTTNCAFTVTVTDAQNPSFSSCPSSISVGNVTGQCSAAVSWSAPAASDNCPGVSVALTTGLASGSAFSIGTTPIVFTATDAAGNTATCNFNVTVSDVQNPVISCQSNVNVNNSNGQCGASVTFATATATDNCPGVTVAQTAGPSSGSFFSVGTQTITYLATDGANNTASCSFTVTVVDNQAPIFLNCPANITTNTDPASCIAVENYPNLVTNDNCNGSVAPVQTVGLPSGSAYPLGVNTVTWTATDAVGNVGTCSFTVTVSDVEAPLINCPSNQTVTFDGNCQYQILNYIAQVGFLSDNCTSSPNVVQSPAAGTTISGSTLITMTATDANGNTASCTFSVNPNDVVNPTISCPSNQAVAVNSICQFTLPNYTSGAVTHDDCDSSPTVTQSPSVGSILTSTTLVTLTVYDDAGNTSFCTFNAVPLDATNPVINCPSNQLASFNGACQFSLINYTALATRTDNCDASPVVSQSPAVGTIISGATVVTLTATDASSNASTCTFSVLPDDHLIPVVQCPGNLQVSFNSQCLYNIISYTGLVTATDNCDNSLVISQSPVAGTSVGTTTTVTVFATDDDGNVGNCTFNVIPADNTVPNVSCPSTQVVNANSSCQAVLQNYSGSVTASDNCSNSLTIVQSPSSGTTITGSTTVTMTVTDASSNVNTCTFQVVPSDVTNPIVSCPANLSVSFSGSCQYSVGNYVGSTSATDNCDLTPTITQSPSVGTLITGQTQVIMTATDDNGNAGTCTFNIIPNDTQNPTVTCPSTQSVFFGSACNFSLADYTGLATASDNCDQSLTRIQSPGVGSIRTATTVVTITVADDANNMNSCTFSVVPSDNTNPSITCPVNQNANFGASCSFTIPSYTGLGIAADNCDSSVDVTQSPASGTTITGATTIILTATDNYGNIGTCTFNVLPDDHTNPTIACPSNQFVSFNAQCTYNLLSYASLGTASDNCDASLSITQSPIAGTAIGTSTSITLTATDDNGNIGSCTFNVIPNDNTNPLVQCPGNVTVTANSSCQFVLLNYVGATVASDNCTSPPTVTQNPSAGTIISGPTTVTMTAEDAAENLGICTFSVSPLDNTNPSITCPANQTASFDNNCQFTLGSYSGLATSADNCTASPAITQSPSSGTLISGGTVVTLTATDGAGNLANCTFSVIPSDQQNPTIACPANQIVSSNSDCDVLIVDYTSTGTAADNCDASLTVTQSPAFGTIITVPTTITLTATDDALNAITCSFLVTPADDDNPSLSCPGNQLEDFDADCEFDLIDYTVLATATDNCSGAPTVTQSPVVGSIISGQTTITLTATDVDLNTATCTFQVNPDDNTAPSVVCPANQNVSFNDLCQYVMTNFTGSATSTDNCDPAPVHTQSPTVGTLIGGSTVVTVSSTDASGNIGTCTFTIVPADNSMPVVACPLDITEPFDANCEFTLTSYTSFASVTDNCSTAPFTVVQSPVSGTSIFGNTSISLSVTDATGNTGSCTFNVIPDDAQDPSITCPSGQTVSFNSNCQFVLEDYFEYATVIDNCDQEPVITQVPAIGSLLSLNTIVVLTATDASGNTASCSFNVNPEDDIDPTIVCPTNQNVAFTTSCQFSLPDYTGSATADDNCDNTPFVTQSPGIGNLISGNATVTLTVTDDAGNSSNCTFQILPTDIHNPTITCPQNVVQALSASCDFNLISYTGMAITNDNCDASVTVSQSPPQGSTISSNTVITLTGTDDGGNSASCTFSVLVTDQTSSVATCPPNQQVSFGPSCQFTVPNYTTLASAADNCDPTLSVAQQPLAGSTIGGLTTVTISFTDDGGNVGSCAFTVTPSDGLAPIMIGCPSNFTVNNNAGSCSAVVTYAAISATDNCDGLIVPTLTSGQASGTVFPVGPTVVTYTATDANSNVTTCQFVVTVVDNEAPVISCPSNISTTTDPTICGAVVNYSSATAIDNCATGMVPTLSVGLASGSTFSTGNSTITYTVNDGNGNSSSCSFTISIVDDENPVITCPSNISVNASPNTCSAFVSYNLPTVADNCVSGIVPSLVAGQVSGSSFQLGITTVSYSANDGSGNASTCSFTVSVVDNTAPIIFSCPLNISANVAPSTCGAVVNYVAINASDNCTGALVPALTSGLASGSIFPLGATTVTYTANDGNGNQTVCSFVVTIVDNEAPIITCPSSTTINATVSTCGANVSYSFPTVTDNCTSGIVPVLQAGMVSGSNFPVGTTLVTYLANDGNGNSSSCSFNITVLDAENPVITCPSNISVNNNLGLCGATVNYNLPTVTDNCTLGIVPTLTVGLASGSLFSVAVTTVSYQAVDLSGNINTCSFTVTVSDNELPVLTCPSDITIGTDAGVCRAAVSYASVVVSDNCSVGLTAVLQVGLGSGDPFSEGTTTVTYSASDVAGNTNTCSFNVTVFDDENPSITCPSNLTESFNASCHLVLPDYTSLSNSADNCDSSPLITQSPAVGSVITGTTTVSLIATDVEGNSSSCTFVVSDNTPPVVVCPVNQLVATNINCQYALLNYSAVTTSSDNCGSVVLAQLPVAGTLISSLTTVTMTASDNLGNQSSCQFTVTLTDNIAPSITCIGNQLAFFDSNCEFQLPNYTIQAGASDNCDTDPVITQSPAAGSTIFGSSVITLTASDDNGNSTSCSFNVNPVDVIPPSVACPSSQVAQFDGNCQFTIANYTGLAVTDDNCSTQIIVSQLPAIGTIHSGNTIVTLTANDGNGNAASCVFLVLPEDNVAPSIICPADFPVFVNSNCEYSLINFADMGTSSDNCSSSFTVSQNPAIGVIINDPTTITLTTNDGNGNSSSCNFVVTPTDNTAPTINCGTGQVVAFNENCQFQLLDYTSVPSISDNCSSNILVTQNPAAGTLIFGTTSLTMTANDGNGNSSSCTLQIIPIDVTVPTIVCPEDQIVSFNQNCGYALLNYTSLAIVSDNCATNIPVTQNYLPGNVVFDQVMVTLSTGNSTSGSASCSFMVIPSDNTDPTIVCPPNASVSLNSNCQFVLPDYGLVTTVADNCGSTTVTQAPAVGASITVSTSVQMTVTDGNDNSVSCSFTVVPTDTQLPTITCPSNQSVALNSSCQYQLPDYGALALASDNCTSALSIAQFPPAGTFVIANTAVSLSVQDASGNTATCSLQVSVQDQSAPVIAQCPAPVNAVLNSNCSYVVPNFISQIVATDNCDASISYQQQPLAGAIFTGAGSQTITMIALDDAGNTDSCMFNVNLTDMADPVVTCPPNQSLGLNANCQYVLPSYTPLATASDACGSVVLTQSPPAASIITTQLNATIIATDANGNTATCTFFVSPIPMTVSVAGTNVTCDNGTNGTATVSVAGGTPPYTQNWGGFNPNALSAGNYQVTVTDVNGCSVTGSVTINNGTSFQIELNPSGDVQVCSGESVVLNAGSGYAVYNWSTGASVSSITVSSPASYWVTVTNAQGCVSNTDTVHLSFYPPLVPDVTLGGDGVLYCTNDSSSSYQWYFNGGPIANATSYWYCPHQSGNFYVRIIDANGCAVNSTIEEHTYDLSSACATGIQEHDLSLDIYPNPSNGLFTVSYSLQYQNGLRLAVFDLMGKQVGQEIQLNSISGSTIIDLSGQADGVYSLRVALGKDRVFQERLVLVK